MCYNPEEMKNICPICKVKNIIEQHSKDLNMYEIIKQIQLYEELEELNKEEENDEYWKNKYRSHRRRSRSD